MDYLIMLAVLFALFHRSIFCSYVVDDTVRHQVMIQRKKQGVINCLLNHFDDVLYGAGIFRNAQQEYLFTTLLHYANCCLIYSLTDSLMVTILFMVNPVNNQLAIWLNGRRYAISMLACLLAWKFKFLFIPLYVFIGWLHVYAIALPVMILMTPYWPFVPGGVMLIYAIGWKKLKARHDSRKKDFTRHNELQIIRPQKIIIYIKSLGFNFFHTIFPNKPRMYHEFLYYFSRYDKDNKIGYSFNLEFFKGLIVCVFTTYEIFFQHNIWMVWWLVFITQWCNVYGVTQNAADRYCSLAGIGLMFTLNKYIVMTPSPYTEILYTIFISFYVLRYFPLFRAYTSITNFHQYHINLEPSAVESRTLQATRAINARDPFTAFALIKEGLKYRPNDFKLLILMSQTLFAMQKYEAAQKVLDIAEKHVPDGEIDECKVEFAKIRSNPQLQPIKLNRKQRRARGV